MEAGDQQRTMHTRTIGAHSTSGDKHKTPHDPTDGTAKRLGWKVGDSDQTCNVGLKNISRGGVAALANAVPPRHHHFGSLSTPARLRSGSKLCSSVPKEAVSSA